MDFGRFDSFWQRVAQERFGGLEAMTIEAILARGLTALKYQVPS
jgi:hypothetical protein